MPTGAGECLEIPCLYTLYFNAAILGLGPRSMHVKSAHFSVGDFYFFPSTRPLKSEMTERGRFSYYFYPGRESIRAGQVCLILYKLKHSMIRISTFSSKTIPS